MTQLPAGPGYLTLQSWAFQRNSKGGYDERQLTVLCGDNPPTITDGYAKWGTIDRPLRTGVTIPQGYNPAQMQVNVRFGIYDGRFIGITSDGKRFGGGWDTRSIAATEVEKEIGDLNWMAGGSYNAGPSPQVYIDTYDAKGTTNLIPKDFQGLTWVIDQGIQWGNSLRHPNGSRIYQEAQFTMLEYTAIGAKKRKEQHQQSGHYVKTTITNRTALSIAAAQRQRSPEAYHQTLAKRICHSPNNNPCQKSSVRLERKSIHWKMPVGLNVWVPEHGI